MMQLLFDPNGRIAPPAFWRGYIVTLAAALVIQVVSYFAGQGLATSLLGLVSLVTYWWTIALFVKRLHDAGASGWWTALVAAGWTIVVAIVAVVIMSVFGGEVMSTAMTDESYAQSPQFALDLQERVFVPITAAVLVINIILGFILANLKSDPASNRFGPPTRGPQSDVF